MPRITDLLSQVFSIVIFKLTATGSEMKIGLGFKPNFILIWNKTNPSVHIWMSTMAAASYGQIVNDDLTQLANVSSGGIDAYDGEQAAADGTNDFYIKGSTKVATALTSGEDIPEGFKVGTEAVINTADDELHVVALKIG